MLTKHELQLLATGLVILVASDVLKEELVEKVCDEIQGRPARSI